MKKQLLILFAAAAAGMFAAAPAAQACDGCGYGYGIGYLYNSLDYNVPYFAAHPPVYYSYPVPRTYGYSPFAYPPNVMTPDVAAPPSQPLEVINPHVPTGRDGQASAPVDRTTATQSQPTPLVIVNPFVAAGRSVAQADVR